MSRVNSDKHIDRVFHHSGGWVKPEQSKGYKPPPPVDSDDMQVDAFPPMPLIGGVPLGGKRASSGRATQAVDLAGSSSTGGGSDSELGEALTNVSLSEGQARALSAIARGKSVFYTGAAGSTFRPSTFYVAF
jgi:hypothetical protein